MRIIMLIAIFRKKALRKIIISTNFHLRFVSHYLQLLTIHIIIIINDCTCGARRKSHNYNCLKNIKLFVLKCTLSIKVHLCQLPSLSCRMNLK